MTRTIEHKPFTGVRIEVTPPVDFDEVPARLRNPMGRVSTAEIVDLAQTPMSEVEFARTVEAYFESESGFMLFAEIDQGGWLPKFGINQRTVRWILGTPPIAGTMIRHDITVGVVAPAEILVTEAEDRQGAVIAYLRPSSLMVIEKNPPLRAAAVRLDSKMDKLVANTTEL